MKTVRTLWYVKYQTQLIVALALVVIALMTYFTFVTPKADQTTPCSAAQIANRVEGCR